MFDAMRHASSLLRSFADARRPSSSSKYTQAIACFSRSLTTKQSGISSIDHGAGNRRAAARHGLIITPAGNNRTAPVRVSALASTGAAAAPADFGRSCQAHFGSELNLLRQVPGRVRGVRALAPRLPVSTSVLASGPKTNLYSQRPKEPKVPETLNDPNPFQNYPSIASILAFVAKSDGLAAVPLVLREVNLDVETLAEVTF